MAFASVGSLGTANAGTADQTSLVLTTTATLEAGNLGVIVIAIDNNQTTDGDEGAVSGVVDSAGNTWTKGAEFTNGQGAAQAGSTCSVWYKRVTTQLASGGTITASFTNSTSRDASAATAWEFTVGANVVLEGTPGTLANDGADAGSLNVTTANVECLRIRACAAEGNTAGIATVTSTWTQFTDSFGGGGGTSGQAASAEFLISTGTGAASDPTLDNTTRDVASVYIALREATAYSLAAGGGSYALTGTAATLKHNRKVVAAAGSYAITGQTAAVKHGWKLAAAAGSYALTGSAATLQRNVPVVAGAGSYAVTGTAATIKHAWKVTAAAGSYAITGTDAAPKHGYKVAADAGSYTLAGTDAALKHNWLLNAAAGSYELTGSAATLRRNVPVVAGADSYALSGVSASVLHTWKVAADAGSYLLTGTAASIIHGWRVSAGAGSYVLTGSDASLIASTADISIAADAGSYALTGSAASVLHNWKLAAGPGDYALTGTAASVLAQRRLQAGGGSYLLTGSDATLSTLRRLHAESGIYLLTGTAADITVGTVATGLEPHGGYPERDHIPRKRKKQKESHESREEIRALLRKVMGEDTPAAKAVAKAVAPYVAPSDTRPERFDVDWKGLEAHMSAFNAAVKRYEAYLVEADEDDAEAMLLLGLH